MGYFQEPTVCRALHWALDSELPEKWRGWGKEPEVGPEEQEEENLRDLLLKASF